MNINDYLDYIIGHLGAAAIQRAWKDDKIIADHIDAALAAAKELKAEINAKKQGNGQ